MVALNQKARAGIWSALLQWSRVGINAVVFLVLSRWLSLAEIGAVAAAQAPILVAQSLLTSTFPEFVVQERVPSQRRLSSMFWLSVVLGLLISASLVFLAPAIAFGIDNENTVSYIYAIAVCPLAWSASSVFEGILRKRLHTRILAVRTLVASTFGGTLAITAGYLGFGGWSIICFVLASTFISASMTILSCKWKPGLLFSLRYIRRSRSRLLSLGGRHAISAASLPLLQYVVAFQLGSSAGGVFQIAVRIQSLVDALAMMPYRFIVMPLFARSKADSEALAGRIYDATRIGSLIAAPAYFGVMSVAPVLLPWLLGEENGSACVMAVQILCFAGLIGSLNSVVSQILVARGHAKGAFRISFISYILAITSSLFASLVSVEAVTLLYAIFGGVSGFILSTRAASYYLGTTATRLAKGWFRPFFAGSFLLVLLPFQQAIASKSYTSQLAILSVAAILTFSISTLALAHRDLRLLIAHVRGR